MPSNKLCLHVCAHPIDYTELSEIPTPEMTNSHRPIPHVALVDSVEKEFQAGGFHLVSSQHAVSADRQKYFGLMEVVPPDRRVETSDQYAYTIGIRNSHDKTLSAGLVFGTRVFVCDNLAFSGDYKIFRKHTSGIWSDLPERVRDGVVLATNKCMDMGRVIRQMRDVHIDQHESDHLICNMLRSRILSPQIADRTLRAREEMMEDDAIDYADSLWGLYNAVTGVMNRDAKGEKRHREAIAEDTLPIWGAFMRARNALVLGRN